MGAYYFQVFSPVLDVAEAFNVLTQQARWKNGHGGYTGTIAEKNDYETVSEQPIVKQEVDDWVTRYGIQHDHDKWGPAWHVPVCDKDGKLIGHLFFGYASS